MRQKVTVVSQERFDAWLARKQAGGKAAARRRRWRPETATWPLVGKTLFAEGNGEATACGACHTLSDAGTSGAAGPNLDDVLQGVDARRRSPRRSSIPNKEIAAGFTEGIMPANYGETLTKPNSRRS